MKINMLLLGKFSGHDATFEIDSGAHISLVSKDLVSESDMVPGKITIKVSWDNHKHCHVLVLMLLSMDPSIIN